MLSPGVPVPPSHPDIPVRPVPSHSVSARHVPLAVVPALPVVRCRDWRRPLPRLQCMNLTWALGRGPRAPPPTLPPAHWHNRHQCSSAHHRAHQHLTSRRTLPNRAFQGSKIPRLLRLRQPVATSLHHWSGQGQGSQGNQSQVLCHRVRPPARPLFLPSSNAARRLISTARFTACNLFSHLDLTWPTRPDRCPRQHFCSRPSFPLAPVTSSSRLPSKPHSHNHSPTSHCHSKCHSRPPASPESTRPLISWGPRSTGWSNLAVKFSRLLSAHHFVRFFTVPCVGRATETRRKKDGDRLE